MRNSESVLETPRLQLEPLRRAHAVELFPLLSDSRLYRFIPQSPPEQIGDLTARYERLESRSSPGGDEAWLNWAVRRKVDGVCVGRIEVTIRQDMSALLAYEVGVPHWRQGFATEACRCVIQALFESYEVNLIVAEIDTRNEASIRLVERLGMRRAGLKIGADYFKGSASDEFTFVLARGGDEA